MKAIYPGSCVSNVGRWDGNITKTSIATECFSGPGKIYNGIAWMVLHEVNFYISSYSEIQIEIILLEKIKNSKNLF